MTNSIETAASVVSTADDTLSTLKKKVSDKGKSNKRAAKDPTHPRLVGRVLSVTVGKAETGFSLKLKKGKTEAFSLESFSEAGRASALALLSSAAATRSKVHVDLLLVADGKQRVERISMHG